MNDAVDPHARAVLDYWTPGYRDWKPAEAIEPLTALWFGGGLDTDMKVRSLFKDDVDRMSTGERDGWLQHPYEALAGVILMDQFPRNIYRGTAQMYALDEKARSWSNHLIEGDFFQQFHAQQKLILALPFMHGETLQDQQRCIDILRAEVERLASEGDATAKLCAILQNSITYAERHKDVIREWGRFPHRNAILGRENTPAEEAAFKEGKIPSW